MSTDDCTILPEKRCSHCKQLYPASPTFFHRDKTKKSGLNAACKGCINSSHIAQRSANPEEYRKRQHAAYASNPEKYRNMSRDARAKDPEKHRQRQSRMRARDREKYNQKAREARARDPERARRKKREWYANNAAQEQLRLRERREQNREKYRQWDREGYQRNKAKIYDRHRKARLENPEKYRLMGAQRSARLRGAPRNDLTATQWRLIKQHYHLRCYYCGKQPKKLTMDHIIPITKGGNHTMSNIVPACQSCNSRKGNRKPLIPVQPLLL